MFNDLATKYNLWKCNVFDHKPNRDAVESRERMPDWPFPEENIAARVDWKHEYHYERYTTCMRCDEEITYVRFFNIWRTKAELIDRNLREWLDREDATNVRDTF